MDNVEKSDWWDLLVSGSVRAREMFKNLMSGARSSLAIYSKRYAAVDPKTLDLGTNQVLNQRANPLPERAPPPFIGVLDLFCPNICAARVTT